MGSYSEGIYPPINEKGMENEMEAREYIGIIRG